MDPTKTKSGSQTDPGVLPTVSEASTVTKLWVLIEQVATAAITDLFYRRAIAVVMAMSYLRYAGSKGQTNLETTVKGDVIYSGTAVGYYE